MTVPPCVQDRTSLVGLRALMRHRPHDWHQVLLDGAQPRWHVPGEEASIAEVLRSGVVSSLEPHDARDGGRLWRERSGASRLVLAVGERASRDIDDAFVERLRIDLTDELNPILGKPLAASTASRTLTVLRKAARAWATQCRVPVAVDRIPRGPTQRIGARRERDVVSLYEIVELLRASGESLRAAIGLAVGAGLEHGEIISLRRQQVIIANRGLILFATVPGSPRLQGHLRYAWLPPWAMDLVDARHPRLRSMTPGAYLFPAADCWDRPCSGLHAALARACEEVWGPDGPRYTFGDLRRSWQAVGRAHAMPRVVVRQSWGVWLPRDGSAVRLPEGVHALRRLMGGWKTLGDATGRALIDPVPVPRQAAQGTGPWEPEPMEKPPPGELPDSCGL